LDVVLRLDPQWRAALLRRLLLRMLQWLIPFSNVATEGSPFYPQ
jgi:hypothetical protein